MESVRFSIYEWNMKETDFERCFFNTVLAYGIEKFGKQNAFAEAVFQGMTKDSANSTLMQIKNKSSRTGQPRGLRLSEAYKMAEAAGIPFSTLALEAETKIRLGWSEEAERGSAVKAKKIKKSVMYPQEIRPEENGSAYKS